jgi:histidine decarboxylase
VGGRLPTAHEGGNSRRPSPFAVYAAAGSGGLREGQRARLRATTLQTCPRGTSAELRLLARRIRQARRTKVGFPGADDVDYRRLDRFGHWELNNIGGPFDDPAYAHHTKAMEREVIHFFADLFDAPPENRWGYVTSGSTECLVYALLRARAMFPRGVIYSSAAAHYKVARIAADLRIPHVTVASDQRGEMCYPELLAAVAARSGRPAIVVATVGTTMTEAIDDVTAITEVLDVLGVSRRYLHVDAALAGIPLALLPDGPDKPNFGFRAGIDSLSFSTHKFLATRWPGGIVLTREPPVDPMLIAYTGAADSVVSCSRNGHTVLRVWYCIRTLGRTGLRQRADQSREIAATLVDRLTAAGWPAWRHRHAFTVVLKTPPPAVAARWQLASDGDGFSHYVCLPGRGRRRQVARFIADLDSATTAGPSRGVAWLRRLIAAIRPGETSERFVDLPVEPQLEEVS